jgi:hypothetical protein
MPKPKKYEKEPAYLKRCIPQVINEGKGKNQAVAICKSIFEKK